MYNGWIESQEQIEERKARILADYAPEPAPAWTIGGQEITVIGDHDEDTQGES